MKLSENKDLKDVLANENASIDEIVESIESIVENKLEKGNDIEMNNRPMNKEEMEYFENLANSLQAKQNLNIDGVHLPHGTVIDLERGMNNASPIVNAIPKIATKNAIFDFVLGKGMPQRAVVGRLTDAITQEITQDIEVKTIQLAKMSCYGELAQDFIRLGMTELRGQILAAMAEAMSREMERAFIQDTIIMTRRVGDGAPEFQPVTALDRAQLMPIMYKAQVDGNGRFQKADLILAVNPADYFNKLAIGAECMTIDGKQASVLPEGLKMVVCDAVPTGKAIIFNPQNFKLVMGQDIKVEHSTDFKFLEDIAVWKSVALFAFIELVPNAQLLDVSGVQPAVIKVKHEE